MYAKITGGQKIVFTEQYIAVNDMSESFYKVCVEGIEG